MDDGCPFFSGVRSEGLVGRTAWMRNYAWGLIDLQMQAPIAFVHVPFSAGPYWILCMLCTKHTSLVHLIDPKEAQFRGFSSPTVEVLVSIYVD
jgi:hypothetical protein